MNSFIDQLNEKSACKEGIAYALTHKNARDAWEDCTNTQWMLWALSKFNLVDEKKHRLFACQCIRYTPISDDKFVWDLLTDERSKNAVIVAERFANGEATAQELDNARSAAWSAAESTPWGAARSAARSAAWGAVESAWGAPGAAPGATWSAAWGAENAAENAAESAESAAWSVPGAAWDAAWSAAENAANTARSVQAELLRKIYGFPHFPDAAGIQL